MGNMHGQIRKINREIEGKSQMVEFKIMVTDIKSDLYRHIHTFDTIKERNSEVKDRSMK